MMSSIMNSLQNLYRDPLARAKLLSQDQRGGARAAQAAERDDGQAPR